MEHTSFFVVFSLELTEGDFSEELVARFEELGLRSKIDAEGTILHMPRYSFIGEYSFTNAEDLKNGLYSEIKVICEEMEVSAVIFIAVSEFATIGIDHI